MRSRILFVVVAVLMATQVDAQTVFEELAECAHFNRDVLAELACDAGYSHTQKSYALCAGSVVMFANPEQAAAIATVERAFGNVPYTGINFGDHVATYLECNYWKDLGDTFRQISGGSLGPLNFGPEPCRQRYQRCSK